MQSTDEITLVRGYTPPSGIPSLVARTTPVEQLIDDELANIGVTRSTLDSAPEEEVLAAIKRADKAAVKQWKKAQKKIDAEFKATYGVKEDDWMWKWESRDLVLSELVARRHLTTDSYDPKDRAVFNDLDRALSTLPAETLWELYQRIRRDEMTDPLGVIRTYTNDRDRKVAKGLVDTRTRRRRIDRSLAARGRRDLSGLPARIAPETPEYMELFYKKALHITGGKAKCGKSSLALMLLINVGAGLYIDMDSNGRYERSNGDDELTRKILMYGADPDLIADLQIDFFSPHEHAEKHGGTVHEALLDVLDACADDPPPVIVVDSLSKVMLHAGLIESDPRDCSRALDIFSRLRARTCVVVIDHYGHDNDRLRGGSSKLDDADLVLGVRRAALPKTADIDEIRMKAEVMDRRHGVDSLHAAPDSAGRTTRDIGVIRLTPQRDKSGHIERYSCTLESALDRYRAKNPAPNGESAQIDAEAPEPSLADTLWDTARDYACSMAGEGFSKSSLAKHIAPPGKERATRDSAAPDLIDRMETDKLIEPFTRGGHIRYRWIAAPFKGD
ncbi:AAA family ATPase [Gordonia sp. (in: high G+C Gram-positive bacteria)]|uniref:AAA family ATPase n=1 Tax=Gordonia sp. (in: high G+C Gram-positive bacteria) TaxID=84139 RepID=UPI0039E72628